MFREDQINDPVGNFIRQVVLETDRFRTDHGWQNWFVEIGGSEQWAPAYYNGNVYTWLGA